MLLLLSNGGMCRHLADEGFPQTELSELDQWPVQEIGNIPANDKEIRVVSHITLISLGSALDLSLRHYSSWPHLQTLMAWLSCFVEAMLVVNTYSLSYARNFGYYKHDHLSDEYVQVC